MPRSGRRTKQATEVYSASFSSAFRFLIARSSLDLSFFTFCATSMASLCRVHKAFAGHTPSLNIYGGKTLGTEAKPAADFSQQQTLCPGTQAAHGSLARQLRCSLTPLAAESMKSFGSSPVQRLGNFLVHLMNFSAS